MIDIDEKAERFISGEPSGCPYLDELARGVRDGEISISDLKMAMRDSLEEAI